MYLSWKNAFRTAAALATASFAACDKPIANEDQPDAELPVVAQSTPAATPVATPSVATPEPNYFAPPGVYYLVATSSVETPEGIVGLAPGTRLQKVAPGKYTAAGHQLELRDSQVTNDTRIAQRVAGADQAAQAALRQAMQSAAAQAANAARANAPTAPSATPNTIVAVGQPSRSTVPRPGVGSSLGSSGAFGKTRSQDGWIWQLDGNGDWQPIRPDR
jgi:hypothetical protein